MPVVSGTQYASLTDLGSVGLTAAAMASIAVDTQTAALVAASAIADSYLQSRYSLPLTSWGKDLARVVAVVAAYDLLSTRGFNPAAGADVNWRQRYLDALEWLQEVSRGTQTPAYVVDSSISGGDAATSTGADGSVNTATAGAFQVTTSPVRGWTNRGADKPGWEQ